MSVINHDTVQTHNVARLEADRACKNGSQVEEHSGPVSDGQACKSFK